MLKPAIRFRTQLACLGEASRFRLVRVLQARSRYVTELASEVGLSQSCTTRHLQALKRCGLVCAERRGKRVMYRLCSEDPRAASLLDWALADRTLPKPAAAQGRSATRIEPSGRAAHELRDRPRLPAAKPTAPGTLIPTVTKTAVGNPSPTPSPSARRSTSQELRPTLEPAGPASAEESAAAGAEDSAAAESEATSPAPNPRRSNDLEDFLL